MKRAFEPVVEPVAPPTTLLEALLAAPQLRQIPADVFKYLVVPFARSRVEVTAEVWREAIQKGEDLLAAPELELQVDGSPQPEVKAYFDELVGCGNIADQHAALVHRGDLAHLLLLAVYGAPHGLWIHYSVLRKLTAKFLPDGRSNYYLERQYERLMGVTN